MEGTTPDTYRMSDNFWTKDVSVLIRSDNLLDVLPKKHYTTEEILNSLVRLSFYISLLLSLVRKNGSYFIILLVVSILSIIVYNISKNKKERFGSEKKCKKEKLTYPTDNNPYMNKLAFDKIDKPKAVKYYDNSKKSAKIRKDISKKYNNLFGTDKSNTSNINKLSEHYNFLTLPDSLEEEEEFYNFLNMEILNGSNINRKTMSDYDPDLRYAHSNEGMFESEKEFREC